MTTITTGVGSPGTVGASGGKVYAFNTISSTPQTLILANPSRQKLTFYNPGTVDAYAAPASVQNTGSDVPLVPSPSALGGCMIIYANGGILELIGEVQKPWQIFSASGTTNPLTVIDSNV